MTATLASVPLRGILFFVMWRIHCSSGTQSASCLVVVGLHSSAAKQLHVEVTMQLSRSRYSRCECHEGIQGNRCKAPLISKLGIRCERSASQPGDEIYLLLLLGIKLWSSGFQPIIQSICQLPCLYQVPKLKMRGHTNLESPVCHVA